MKLKRGLFLCSLVLSAVGLLRCSCSQSKIETRFSPNGGCTDMIIRAIEQSNERVLVQAYSFTSVPIGNALVKQKQKGKYVAVILDKIHKSKKTHSLVPLMIQNGIPVYIDEDHDISHNKVIVFDDDKVYTGSMNLTKAGEEKNAENCNLITDNNTNKLFNDNWLKHKEHSKLYQ